MAKESTTNTRSSGSTGTSSRRQTESSQASGSGNSQDLSSNEVSSDRKSIGAIISQSLAEESQEGIDRVLGEIKEYFESGRTYIQENPREAAGLAIAAGVAAWALLGTKPGRVLFEAGAAIAVPYVTRWVSTNMKAVSH
ncbi:MAG: hypothetical protein AB7H97_20710 [Pseudobdellovibrionaceae bacterium]